MSSEMAPSDLSDETFRPALLVVDMQEDFCLPVSIFSLLEILSSTARAPPPPFPSSCFQARP